MPPLHFYCKNTCRQKGSWLAICCATARRSRRSLGVVVGHARLGVIGRSVARLVARSVDNAVSWARIVGSLCQGARALWPTWSPRAHVQWETMGHLQRVRHAQSLLRSHVKTGCRTLRRRRGRGFSVTRMQTSALGGLLAVVAIKLGLSELRGRCVRGGTDRARCSCTRPDRLRDLNERRRRRPNLCAIGAKGRCGRQR